MPLPSKRTKLNRQNGKKSATKRRKMREMEQNSVKLEVLKIDNPETIHNTPVNAFVPMVLGDLEVRQTRNSVVTSSESLKEEELSSISPIIDKISTSDEVSLGRRARRIDVANADIVLEVVRENLAEILETSVDYQKTPIEHYQYEYCILESYNRLLSRSDIDDPLNFQFHMKRFDFTAHIQGRLFRIYFSVPSPLSIFEIKTKLNTAGAKYGAIMFAFFCLRNNMVVSITDDEGTYTYAHDNCLGNYFSEVGMSLILGDLYEISTRTISRWKDVLSITHLKV